MSEPEEYEMMKADGFDDAVIGVAERCSHGSVIVYDFDKCVEILMERDGMTDDDAMEHMSYNVTGAYVGEGTPFFLHRGTMEEIDEYYGDEMGELNSLPKKKGWFDNGGKDEKEKEE